MFSLEPGPLVAGLLISSVGFVVFVYGKRQRRLVHMAVGAALLVYPYFVTNVVVMFAIAALLLALLWMLVRRFGA